MVSEIISYIYTYLLIGVVVIMSMDIMLKGVVDDDGNEVEFTNAERVLYILLWPLSLYHFIRGMYQDHE